jgi:hypothetical protein
VKKWRIAAEIELVRVGFVENTCSKAVSPHHMRGAQVSLVSSCTLPTDI